MPIPKAELMRRLYARRRDERLVAREERLAVQPKRHCAVCGGPIWAGCRTDVITCSEACRVKRSRARRREVYLAARLWLEDGPGGPRRFDVEGIAFRVCGLGDVVQIEADHGDERLDVEIRQDGVTRWHARGARLEQALWATACRLWLPPPSAAIYQQRRRELLDAWRASYCT